jgi:hypothetical protein
MITLLGYTRGPGDEVMRVERHEVEMPNRVVDSRDERDKRSGEAGEW